MAKSTIIRKFILGVLSLVILLIGINGYKALVRSGKKRLPVDSKTQPLEVTVISVKHEDVPTYLTGYGTVRGKREVLIIPEVGGKITSINPNFVAGKLVKKRDVLFTIDTRTPEIEIDKINSEIAKLTAQINTINQEVENIKRNLEITKDHIEIAKRDLERDKDLFGKNMVSGQQVDRSRRTYLQERNSKINHENKLVLIPLKIKELTASIEVKKAERAETQLKIQKSVVKAPFDGIVFDEKIENSQVIKSGEKVGTLVDSSTWEIPVDLNEQNIGHLSFEKFENVTPWKYPCTVFWSAQKDTVKWKGYISRIEKINEKTRTVRVVIEVPNFRLAEVQLAKGMFCKVVLPGRSYNDVIAISAAALHDSEIVYTSVKGRLQAKKVKLLQRVDGTVIIGSGLDLEDKVVISKLLNPVIGMPLKERRQINNHKQFPKPVE